ncbi:KGG domain-containing protein [Hymenobacter sp. BT770]|uniref:KGG domain-containing protein n=1 Tax=Hymenobacter sp. BT770 TaxID=2886942 RepID=UPI001D10C32D|nr:KGG domain-containing protein [Hymenobacter sp. BT770]MCC3155248.1 KGG domain-containing protein [Hymenobacter sp. BT770]MDO3417204.1 KGG domain-containing protein [Hymenobacter sp. BT770]
MTTSASELANSAAAAAKSSTRPATRVGTKSRRGFAAMSPETQRRIASEGGKASHASGRGHRFSAEEARDAGRKGGLVSRRGKTTVPAAK